MPEILKPCCFMLLLFQFAYGYEAEFNLLSNRCLRVEETPSWNRTFHFNNRGLNLTLEVTDKPSHWILNYIFGILAHERLGYHNITFLEQIWDREHEIVHRLACGDASCTELPRVHINLEAWLPLGTTSSFWAPASKVTDHGPLGPVTRWALITNSDFVQRLNSVNVSHLESLCDPTLTSLLRDTQAETPHSTLSLPRIHHTCDTSNDCSVSLWQKDITKFLEAMGHTTDHQKKSQSSNSSLKTVLMSWYPNGVVSASTLPGISSLGCDLIPFARNRTDSFRPNRCLPRSHGSSSPDCLFGSHQATKLSWAKLATDLPLIHQLINSMRLSQEEFDELLTTARLSASFTSDVDRKLHYYNIACEWVRRSPNLWKSWTEGWNKKQNLTIAGLFSLYGKWVIPDLHSIAVEAIRFVNNAPDYFSNTEYALTLDVRNLTCIQDVVVNDYFGLLKSSTSKKLIGVIAALCSDSIEPVVEVANHRRQLIVSPTVESTRIVDDRDYPYFFRTVPSMLNANLALIRIFLHWGWRRMAVFRKDNHFFEPRLYQASEIDVTIDVEMKEYQLTYEFVNRNLNKMVEQNLRIFVIEHFAHGTALILCAAFHLGLHFNSGYVWLINPWLSEGWWKPPNVIPPQCTPEEMANITSWTFTITHQLVVAPMLHSSLRFKDTSPPSTLTNDDVGIHTRSNKLLQTKSTRLKDQESRRFVASENGRTASNIRRDSFSYGSNDYAFYTYESVLVLATALVQLLQKYPSAISILESPEIASAYRHFVASTNFGYTGNWDVLSVQPIESLFSPQAGFFSPGEFYGTYRRKGYPYMSQLRFNEDNERVADYWLLKQHQPNQTASIVMVYLKAGVRDVRFKLSDIGQRRVVDYFNQLVTERWLDPVQWGNNGGVPDDGSDVGKDCSFWWLTRLLQVNCSTAIIIFSVTVIVLIVVPLFVLFIAHYRRKLKEAERRIRQPYEDLCAELADIDIPCSDIVLNRRVGQGAFGMVFGGEAKRKGTWEAVAVKVIGGKATYEGKRDFLSEAKLMRELGHKNVVRLIGVCLRPRENHLYLIMEVVLLGDLRTYLLCRRVLAQQTPDNEYIRPRTLTQMAIDIAEGVAYLHSKSLVHRDIASRNCLVGSDLSVKIGDFGLTRKLTNPDSKVGYYRFTQNCELPIRWMSPEAIQFGIFSVQSDLWSYGVVLYEIITFGAVPYDGLGNVEVVERIKQIDFSILDFLPLAALNSTVAALIDQCCQHQWQHRPESILPVIQRLRANPDCVRPFLTDEPPKPNITIDALPFQPGAGACMMSENALTSEGPNPANTIALTETLSNNHSTGTMGATHVREFHSTAGSLVGVGRCSLTNHSIDSFSDATAAALRMVTSEGNTHIPGRRRHKTADGAVGLVKSTFLRKGTSCSSGAGGGHAEQGSQISFDDPKSTSTETNVGCFHNWSSVADQVTPSRIGVDTNSQVTRALPHDSRKHRIDFATHHHSRCKEGHSVCELTPMLPTPPVRDGASEQPPSPGTHKCTPWSHTSSFTISCEQHDGIPLLKQANGTLSSGLRSLSAEYLVSEHERVEPPYCSVKSAPEGHASTYISGSQVPFDRKIGESGPDVLIESHHGKHSGFFRTAKYSSGRSPQLVALKPISQPNARSVADNASSLIRSMLRVFIRTPKVPPNSHENLLRTSKSSTSCRMFGVRTQPFTTSQPVAVFDSINLSTSCPPLSMIPLLTTNSQLSEHNPLSGTPASSSFSSSPISAPPVQQQYHFFPNTSLSDFGVTSARALYSPIISPSSASQLPAVLSEVASEVDPGLPSSPRSSVERTYFTLSPSSTPPFTSATHPTSNQDHSFYLV